MIIDLDIAKQEVFLKNIEEEKLKRKLKALEKAIRKHTNNNFIDPRIRFEGCIENGKLISPISKYLRPKDNVELTHCLCDGPYTVDGVDGRTITVNEEGLIDSEHVIITKIIYPEDMQEGVLKLLEWDFGVGKKVGIKSETLSRRSVTYFDMDKNNSLRGYPVSLLGFLEDYVKARF